ncbi:MAG: selenide, water dikinase SelD [Actinomycetia bacterium]|nr:selenide, water dikinase SelD [Actinomycetes bacterium]
MPEPGSAGVRLTQYAAGGGCACKIPPSDLESLLAGLAQQSPSKDLVVGLESGDDGAVVRLGTQGAVISTADFFTPVVDNPFDWGRIAAANALSDVYAMGGEPILAINLLGWPSEKLDLAIAREVLDGGAAVCQEAGVPLAGGHSIVDPEPKYGMAVTGWANPDHLLRNDAAQPGTAITLTKPLGLGVLNNRHKVTGEVFPQAIETMTTLNRDAARTALRTGCRAATDVTGFGLLGHLLKMVRASGVAAIVDSGCVPYLEGARMSLSGGYVPGGTQRNLQWVTPHVRTHVGDDELMLLADAQTSGGLLVAGEVPGYPIIGEFIAASSQQEFITVR